MVHLAKLEKRDSGFRILSGHFKVFQKEILQVYEMQSSTRRLLCECVLLLMSEFQPLPSDILTSFMTRFSRPEKHLILCQNLEIILPVVVIVVQAQYRNGNKKEGA